MTWPAVIGPLGHSDSDMKPHETGRGFPLFHRQRLSCWALCAFALRSEIQLTFQIPGWLTESLIAISGQFPPSRALLLDLLLWSIRSSAAQSCWVCLVAPWRGSQVKMRWTIIKNGFVMFCAFGLAMGSRRGNLQFILQGSSPLTAMHWDIL